MTAVITFNDIPEQNHTFKYERLGVMALENRELYCQRHGYTFIKDVDIAEDRPACWAKIPAILKAFEEHEWVLWADSDTLIFDLEQRLEAFFDPSIDLIVQSHQQYYDMMGIDPAVGNDIMPINTGVFLIRDTEWSRWFLLEAYKQHQFICTNAIWNGIGEQEAMIEVLKQHPEGLRKVGYVEGLQNHPKLYRSGDMFVHFYGCYSRHYIPQEESEEVLQNWETANAQGKPYPDDITRFHWCAIQTKQSNPDLERDDLETYLYTFEDIGVNPTADEIANRGADYE